MSWPPTRFLDGEPIPAGYLAAVDRMIAEVCAIEEMLPLWELELNAAKGRKDDANSEG